MNHHSLDQSGRAVRTFPTSSSPARPGRGGGGGKGMLSGSSRVRALEGGTGPDHRRRVERPSAPPGSRPQLPRLSRPGRAHRSHGARARPREKGRGLLPFRASGALANRLCQPPLRDHTPPARTAGQRGHGTRGCAPAFGTRRPSPGSAPPKGCHGVIPLHALTRQGLCARSSTDTHPNPQHQAPPHEARPSAAHPHTPRSPPKRRAGHEDHGREARRSAQEMRQEDGEGRWGGRLQDFKVCRPAGPLREQERGPSACFAR